MLHARCYLWEARCRRDVDTRFLITVQFPVYASADDLLVLLKSNLLYTHAPIVIVD